MFGLGPAELAIIVVIALVIFGPSKLPELGKGLGKSIKEFKQATNDITKEISEPINEVKKPIAEMKQEMESIRRLPADTLAGVTSPAPSPNGAVASSAAAAQEPVQPSPAPSPLATKTCPQCSHSNEADQVFCGNCGAKLA